MRKKLRRIKSNKAFTLVEVSVSLVVLIILIGVAGGIILVSGNIFSKDAILNDYQIIGNDVFDFVSDKLCYATGFTVSDSADIDTGLSSGYHEQIILSEKGKKLSILRPTVMSESVSFFNSDDEDGKAIGLDFNATALAAGERYIKLTVYIYDSGLDGTVRYTTSGIIPLLNYSTSMTKTFSAASNIDSDNLYITYSFLE